MSTPVFSKPADPSILQTETSAVRPYRTWAEAASYNDCREQKVLGTYFVVILWPGHDVPVTPSTKGERPMAFDLDRKSGESRLDVPGIAAFMVPFFVCLRVKGRILISYHLQDCCAPFNLTISSIEPSELQSHLLVMGSSRKNSQPAPAPSPVDDETSSMTARSGSPSRSNSKTTKKNKTGHRKGKKSSKNEHIDEDISYMGTQFT
ncbi:hypothetical protein BDP55DRAFT_631464 [Colletotrichum godetiae]|uniref:Uncharacterized protein n=1 Tax=Colletotrichum godetiae TaxID=1209918 RepID=A0AAJ0ALV9_9PEZI|nr:uncharacterized protein BDP55DRAFT_631464 [Colletotrichum godetiae]KAK1676301.1 hypothetical protein BDP55DRAFT_631464 [Colletotrichum godetiae]